MAFLSRASGILSGISKSGKGRPPAEAFYIYILALFCGYLVADMSILYVRPAMLPTQPPPMRQQRLAPQAPINVGQFASITDRNMFNSDKKIPPALTVGPCDPRTTDCPGGNEAPVPSQLPLQLQGTMVHANPKKSVASIGTKTKNEVHAFMVDDEIDGMAKVTAIERRKVIFRNLQSGRMEFIEIPSDSAITFGVKAAAPTGDSVTRSGNYDFTMRRGELLKYTADLGSILQQARMVPNIVPGSGGRVDGFKFVAIQPNSIYEKLGFKPMDVIKKVNQDDVNSPTKAMELYNALKSEGRITLTVERDGRDETFTYNISD